MTERLALIGFGEAAQAFAPGLAASLAAFDRKTDLDGMRAAKLAEFVRFGVEGCETSAAALTGAGAALSLVTADQALAAAEAAPVEADCLWFDMNSVAPETKRAAAIAIEGRGGRYVDVAVMAPVHPKRTSVPLLLAGPYAEAGAALLRGLGFSNVSVAGDGVGTASAIKMIRSVMIKGIEALSAECVLAAEAAGVRAAVIASLDASWPGADWAARFDYNLDRMIVHGARRAAEMDEVVRALDALGTGSAMSRATAARQRAIGGRGIAVPDGLDAKLEALRA
ncbi:6-phosphogluconate dehydrogenase [Sphingomonas metalli]|uniref:6-phosphogluconate dehydrogenase n=1 Tax=Sphingomonas metalli TaxID=1779358 RepID=A0A916T613_9SPHN|nr:NAD(P)-dependent oxidoreductase [Sphingomonas metalli]GGB31506.1 6-phosphogluconate dehydrogenase [Sphingomonas metalli]